MTANDAIRNKAEEVADVYCRCGGRGIVDDRHRSDCGLTKIVERTLREQSDLVERHRLRATIAARIYAALIIRDAPCSPSFIASAIDGADALLDALYATSEKYATGGSK